MGLNLDLCVCLRVKMEDKHTLKSVNKDGHLATPETCRKHSNVSQFPPCSDPAQPGQINLSIRQIVKATRNFSPSMELGEGGCGTVYKAELPGGQIVAVKRAKKEYFAKAEAEFVNEAEILGKMDHINLVKVFGYASKGNECIIVTEYVPNGTLREHLDGQHGKVLDFGERLEIAIDVAHALTYLHLYAEKPIIHRDVKSSNILITKSFRAKVADFGFARTGPMKVDQSHVLTLVKGTTGYLDPEYMRTNQLTPKSDVYSFGILLIEILSARRPIELKRVNEERITVRWALKKYQEGKSSLVVDPLMEDVVEDEVVNSLLNLAFQCTDPTRCKRPLMLEVAEKLWELRKYHGRWSSFSSRAQTSINTLWYGR